MTDGSAGASSRKMWIAIGGAVLFVIVVLIVSYYAGFLGARFAPGIRFQILGPDTVVAGKTAIVTWDTSPENQARYPSDKIEFCRSRIFGQDCVTLNPDTTNDGEALVFVPRVPAGAGFLRLTARSRPGGELLPVISSTRPITIVSAQPSAVGEITPVNVGGGVISTLSPAGPRISIAQGGKYVVVLPEPSKNKKVEICSQEKESRCRILAASASGGSVPVTIPSGQELGRAFIKVSERGTDGKLTGRVFYQRAVLVGAASAPAAVAVAESTEAGGDGSGDGNGSTSVAESSPSTVTAAAQFIEPANGAIVPVAGESLNVKVKLIELTTDQLRCQQWKLDGVLVQPSDWISPYSPDLSAGPCP